MYKLSRIYSPSDYLSKTFSEVKNVSDLSGEFWSVYVEQIIDTTETACYYINTLENWHFSTTDDTGKCYLGKVTNAKRAIMSTYFASSIQLNINQSTNIFFGEV